MLEGKESLAWGVGGLIVIEMSKSGGSVLEKKCLAWGVGGLIFIELSKSCALERWIVSR